MKNMIFLAIAAALFTGCDETAGVKDKVAETAISPSVPEQLTSIQWIDSSRNYGKINEGQVLEVSFRFKNTGDKPLVIKDVRPGCGCTLANKPEKPILPGEEGEINATFDSKGREGIQSKDITVIANTKDKTDHVVHFDVEVASKKN